jgi:hypothetical protein
MKTKSGIIDYLEQFGENLVGRALHLLFELAVELLLQLLLGERQLDLLLLVLFEDEHLRRQSCQCCELKPTSTKVDSPANFFRRRQCGTIS